MRIHKRQIKTSRGDEPYISIWLCEQNKKTPTDKSSRTYTDQWIGVTCKDCIKENTKRNISNNFIL